ncbi:MAG TPA: SAM-dependent methyltransferase [Solirubrobacterales bacterium]|nr:SAM-dependent methyltransferase [Solirubrobacterales bacterium]
MAMEKGTERASTTALAVLSAVAAAGSERDPEVRIADPIAPRLLRWSDGKYTAGRLPLLHPLMRRAMERQTPGGYGYTIARMHHMDSILRAEVEAGLDRVVILGAGYDTRAHRLRDSLTGVAVFEVDHPATLRDKRERLGRLPESALGEVTYVEVDFTHQNLLERLASHGHATSDRTLFLLSGVAMFLPEPAVLELFDQIAEHTSSRTSLLFDYAYADVLQHPDRYYGGAKWVPFATDASEEPRSGFPPERLGTVLAEHGLRLDSDIGPDQLTERYLHRSDGSLVAPTFGFTAIAHAFASAQASSDSALRSPSR